MEINTPDTSKSLGDRAIANVIQFLPEGFDGNSELIWEAELLTSFLPRLKFKLVCRFRLGVYSSLKVSGNVQYFSRY